MNSTEFFIARRYFRAKRKTGFISIITYVSIVGVTIGVMALIITLSIMNGFENEVRGRLINSTAHLRIRKFHTEPIEKYVQILDTLSRHKSIVAATPTIMREGVIRSAKSSQPCVIKAIDTASFRRVYEVNGHIVSGSFNLKPVIINGREVPSIILGRYLAENLFVFNPGKIVTLFSISEQASLLTPPRVRQFYVAGIIEMGFYDFDKVLAFISLEEGQRFFKTGQTVTWIEAKVTDYNKAREIGDVIEEELSYPFTVFTWFDLNKNLFNWMTIEKWGTFVVLSLIIMVAAFNIISTLIMIVMEKTKDIGILKSMGASPQTIMRVFLYESMIVGMLGGGIGTILGVALCILQQQLGIISLPSDVYIISKLPVMIEWIDVFAINAASIILCLLAGVYPAFKASRLNPVEAIRYE